MKHEASQVKVHVQTHVNLNSTTPFALFINNLNLNATPYNTAVPNHDTMHKLVDSPDEMWWSYDHGLAHHKLFANMIRHTAECRSWAVPFFFTAVPNTMWCKVRTTGLILMCSPRTQSETYIRLLSYGTIGLCKWAIWYRYRQASVARLHASTTI